MRSAVTPIQMLVRLVGLILIILGVLFWTDHADALVPLHILLGIVLVLALWTLAGLANRAGIGPGIVATAVVWGIVVIVVGLIQQQVLNGGAHWVIQVLHLLLGLGAIALAEMLGARLKGRRTAGANALLAREG